MNSTADPTAQAAAAAAMAAQIAAVRAFNIEAFTLLGIAVLATCLRTYARVQSVGFKHLAADDYFCWAGVIFYAAETGLAYSVGEFGHGLANNSMTDAQRAALDPHSMEYHFRVVGSKIQVAGWSSYSLLLWCLKASMCAFFLRLTAGINGYRKRIYFGFGFIAVTWIAIALTLLLSCRPLYGYWQIYPDPGPYCQPATSPVLIWTFLSLNVATDLYLISIPMPMLWKSNMPLTKKMALIGLFGCGLFVTMAAILRVVLIVTDQENGALLAGSWAVRETFVAVITTNLPMLFPLFKTWLSPIVGTLTTSIRGSTNKTGGSGSSGFSKYRETIGGGGRNRQVAAHPLDDMTGFNHSEEYIVEGPRRSTSVEADSHRPSTASRGKSDGVMVHKVVEIRVSNDKTAANADLEKGQFNSGMMDGPGIASSGLTAPPRDRRSVQVTAQHGRSAAGAGGYRPFYQ